MLDDGLPQTVIDPEDQPVTFTPREFKKLLEDAREELQKELSKRLISELEKQGLLLVKESEYFEYLAYKELEKMKEKGPTVGGKGDGFSWEEIKTVPVVKEETNG